MRNVFSACNSYKSRPLRNPLGARRRAVENPGKHLPELQNTLPGIIHFIRD
jgi:hypothetical protein